MKEIELIEKRKFKEKHFLQEDGSIIAKIYDENVHYLNNGHYYEINNKLIKSKNEYLNQDNILHVKFTENCSVNVEMYGSYIKMNIKNIKESISMKTKQLSKLKSEIYYKNVFPNIDIKYELNSMKVKEKIILKNKNINIDDLIFELETNVNLESIEDGSILAKKDNKEIFVFDFPFMYDSNNEVCKFVKYVINRIDETHYLLYFQLDTNWLFDESRKYPIVIDPSISSYLNDTGVYDTYIFPGDANVNVGNNNILKVGVEKINNQDIINRTLIKFDLPNIGTSCEIINALIHLKGFLVNYDVYNTELLEIHRITCDWNESTAKWNSMNNMYDEKIEACFSSIGSQSINNQIISLNDNEANITNLVKRWYCDYDNYGIMIKACSETYNPDFLPCFFSKDNTGLDFNPTPTLEIRYRNQNGLLKNMKYLFNSLDNCNMYTNVFNGNLVCLFKLLESSNDNKSISLNLVYNTNDAVLSKNYGCGSGFKFDLYQKIIKINIDDVSYLEYLDNTGNIKYFRKIKEYIDENGYIVEINEENIYYSEDSSSLKVEETVDNFILYDNNDNKIYFNLNNGLIEKIESNNNIMFISYDQDFRIISVYDNFGNIIGVSYYNSYILINSLTNTARINLSNNNITSIETINNILSFQYTNGIINKISESNGKKYEYTYYPNSPFKVESIKEIGINNGIGNIINIEYSYLSTTIDSSGKLLTYLFNAYGNVKSITTLDANEDIREAYGTCQNYGEEYQIYNKIISFEDISKYVNNYIPNSYIDEDIIFTSDSNISLLITNEEYNSSKKSIKATCQSNNKSIEKEISVPKGFYYTFSCYLKNNCNMKMLLSYFDNNVEVISENNKITLNDNFVRYSVTLYYPEDATSNLFIKLLFLTQGTAYIDDVQLEKGKIPSSYNFLYNSNFENGLTDWDLSVSNRFEEEEINEEDFFEVVTLDNNEKALKIKMKPVYETSISKDFNISGKAGELYNLSFWYKNEGIFADGIDSYNNVVVNYYSTEEFGTEAAISSPLNTYCNQWQYFSESFIAENDFDGITLAFFQILNANDLYITNISFKKNSSYGGFRYDENGNIIEYNKNLINIEKYKYNSEQNIFSYEDGFGDFLLTEYDQTNKKVISSASASGMTILNHYNNDLKNDRGNIKKNIIFNSFNDKFCKIRLYGTRKYIGFTGNNMFLNECFEKINWLFEEIIIDNEKFYKIKNNIIINKYWFANGNNVVFSNNGSLFEIIGQNGFYLIKLKDEEKYLKYEDGLYLDNFDETNDNFKFIFESFDKFLFECSISKTDNNYELVDTGLMKKNYYISDNLLKEEYTHDNYLLISYNNDLISKFNLIDKEVKYNYNNVNLLSNINVCNLQNYYIEYDEFKNPCNYKIGNNILLLSKYYLPNNGNLSSLRYGNNDVIQFEYDDFGRISKKIKGSNIFNYEYDEKNNLSSIEGNNVNIMMLYDAFNKLEQYQENDLVIKYIYDIADNLIKKIYNLFYINKIEYEYTLDSFLEKLKINDKSIKYILDDFGRIKSALLEDDLIYKLDYIQNGNRLSNMIKTLSFLNNEYKYTYDNNRNIRNIYYNNILIHKYKYDAYNQLIEEDDYNKQIKLKYKYDILGNIISKKTYDINSYNLIDKKLYKYSTGNWKDLLIEYSGNIIISDEIGNITSIGDNIHFNWANGRELTECIIDNQSFKYTYDDIGLRKTKIINNVCTEYYYEGKFLVLQKTGNDYMQFVRDNMGNLIGVIDNNVCYFYIKNSQNDIIAIVDEYMNIIVKYEYDSFGNIISILDNNNNEIINTNNIGVKNPYRYRSYYYDTESDLYYLLNRYYSPKLGRFISPDNYYSTFNGSNSTNMFVYCGNNFINGYDNNGNNWIDNLSSFVGNVTNKVISATKSAKNAIDIAGEKIQNYFSNEYNKIKNYYKQLYAGVVKSFSNSKIIVEGNYILGDSIGIDVPFTEIDQFAIKDDVQSGIVTNKFDWIRNKNEVSFSSRDIEKEGGFLSFGYGTGTETFKECYDCGGPQSSYKVYNLPFISITIYGNDTATIFVGIGVSAYFEIGAEARIGLLIPIE